MTTIIATRITPPWFRGFEVRPSTTITRVCGGTTRSSEQEFISSGAWANCCPTGLSTPCSIATGCLSETIVLYNNEATRECNPRSSCVAQTIWQDPTSSGIGITYLLCASLDTIYPQYRTVEGATYYSGAPLTETTLLSEACVPTCTPTPTRSANPSPEPEVIAASRAWIAGAVVGPVAALALGIILFWVYMRRRAQRRKQPNVAEADGENKVGTKPPDAELDTSHNVPELSSPPPVSELESQTIAELESPFVPHSSRSDTEVNKKI